MEENKIFIPGRLKNAAVGGHVAGTEDIYDDVLEKDQQVINAETDGKITTQSNALLQETSNRVSGDNSLQNQIDAGIREAEGLVFDTVPTKESANPVLSGGIYTSRKQMLESMAETRVTSKVITAYSLTGLTITDEGEISLPSSGTASYYKLFIHPVIKGTIIHATAGLLDGYTTTRKYCIGFSKLLPEPVDASTLVGIVLENFEKSLVKSDEDLDLTVIAPFDGYLFRYYWSDGNTWNSSKSSLKFYPPLPVRDSDEEPTISSQNWVLSGGVAKQVNIKKDYTLPTAVRNCGIKDKNWYNVGYRHILVAVNQGDAFYVEANTTENFEYAWLTEQGTPSNGTPAPLVTGTSKVSVIKGTSAELIVPAAANYLFILHSKTSVANGKCLPSVFQKYKLIKEEFQERIDSLEADHEDITNSVKTLVKSDFYSIANTNVFAPAETNESFGKSNPVIYAADNEYYKVKYAKSQYKKGTIITANWAVSGNSALSISIGFSTVDPAEYVAEHGNLIGLELQNVYTSSSALTHNFTLTFPSDGWFVFRFYTNNSWTTYGFYIYDVDRVHDDILKRLNKLEDDSYCEKELILKNLAWSKSANRSGRLQLYNSENVRIIGNTESTLGSETYMESLNTLGLKAGDIIKVQANTTHAAVFCFGVSWGGGVSPAYDTSIVTLPTGEELHTIPINTYEYFTVPEGANYLFVLRVRQYSGVLENASPAVYVMRNLQEYVDSMPKDYSVFDFYPDKVILPKFMALCKKVRHNAVFSSPSVTFGHISDCHGVTTKIVSNQTWQRFIDFCEYWKGKGYINEIIDTGDIVEDYMINKRTNLDNTTQTDISWRSNAENVLTVIGNHDTASGIKVDGDNDYNWLDNIGVLSYEKYLAPNIENWNVNQPTDAAENGYCFYYKDYVTPEGYNTSGDKTTTSTLTLRAIYVDIMGWGYTHDTNNNLVSDDTQKEWVSSLLVEAANEGYHVVVIVHGMPMRKKRIECSYSSLSASEAIGDEPWSDYNTKSRELCLLIAKFQRGTLTGINANTNGKFLGYVSGHRHYDAISKASGIWDYTSNKAVNSIVSGHECIDFDDEQYPQIEFSVGAGYVKLGELADYYREEKTQNQDNFQIISFQLYNRHVRCLKIGCNVDVYMRKKDMVDVYTGSINEFDPSKTDYTTGLVTKDGIIYRLLKPVVVNNLTSWELSDKVRASRVMSEYVTR